MDNSTLTLTLKIDFSWIIFRAPKLMHPANSVVRASFPISRNKVINSFVPDAGLSLISLKISNLVIENLTRNSILRRYDKLSYEYYVTKYDSYYTYNVKVSPKVGSDAETLALVWEIRFFESPSPPGRRWTSSQTWASGASRNGSDLASNMVTDRRPSDPHTTSFNWPKQNYINRPFLVLCVFKILGRKGWKYRETD